jgi:hypothetical protein
MATGELGCAARLTRGALRIGGWCAPVLVAPLRHVTSYSVADGIWPGVPRWSRSSGALPPRTARYARPLSEPWGQSDDHDVPRWRTDRARTGGAGPARGVQRRRAVRDVQSARPVPQYTRRRQRCSRSRPGCLSGAPGPRDRSCSARNGGLPLAIAAGGLRLANRYRARVGRAGVAVDLGGRVVRFYATPHVPFWEAGLLADEATGTLFCG